MECAGLIYDDSRHYLDHLGPFCSLLELPLIVCEPAVAELGVKYYPNLKIVHIPYWELKLPKQIVACDTSYFLKADFPGQTTNLFWLPHGNSDKGWNSPFFESLGNEKKAFVYGQRMIDFIQTKNNSYPDIFRIGNFRLDYFLKHRSFYESMILLPKNKKNLLYAPTWDDSEKNCSLWKAFPILVKSIPDDWNLIVKLHPNTLRKFEVEIEILMGRYERENVLFLPEIPPIYPILSQCDAYLGDMSSIGYDFLTFDRPMYFFNANPALPLHQCGQKVTPETLHLSTADFLSKIRKETYETTFDPIPNWEELKKLFT